MSLKGSIAFKKVKQLNTNIYIYHVTIYWESCLSRVRVSIDDVLFSVLVMPELRLVLIGDTNSIEIGSKNI